MTPQRPGVVGEAPDVVYRRLPGHYKRWTAGLFGTRSGTSRPTLPGAAGLRRAACGHLRAARPHGPTRCSALRSPPTAAAFPPLGGARGGLRSGAERGPETGSSGFWGLAERPALRRVGGPHPPGRPLSRRLCGATKIGPTILSAATAGPGIRRGTGVQPRQRTLDAG